METNAMVLKKNLESQFQDPNLVPEIRELCDPDCSYNLLGAYSMKRYLTEIDNFIKRLNEVKDAISANYSRTIGEYQEAGITESDGIIIKLLKQGRRSLDEKVAREKFPKECESAQVGTVVFDVDKFKIDHPKLWDEYSHVEYSLTLTALEKHLTDEEVIQVITRAPNTYGVDLASDTA